MEQKELTYSEALRELEEILASIEGGNSDIDTLAAKVTRATALIKLCRSRLVKVESEVNEILSNEQ